MTVLRPTVDDLDKLSWVHWRSVDGAEGISANLVRRRGTANLLAYLQTAGVPVGVRKWQLGQASPRLRRNRTG